MYDLTILKRFIENPEDYRKYRNYLNDDDIGKEVWPLYHLIDNWYAQNTEPLSLGDVANLAVASGKQVAPVLATLQAIGGGYTVANALEFLRRKRILERIAIQAVEASESGDGYDTLTSLFKELGEAKKGPRIDFVTDDLQEILDETVRTPGLRWRLASLNRSLGSLRKGDFGFVFARPETGKTTFLASEGTFMAQQLPETAGPILWINNEEQGRKVKLRLYQAALQATLARILSNPKGAREKYLTIVKDRIKLYDSALISRSQVERMCHELNPSLIVLDQIDKIVGFKADRTDLEMGAIYQWARNIAKEWCPVIGICQADGTGEGEQWLNMGHVTNAKTAKQAEADFIIGIGRSLLSGYEYHRYLNLSKNKLVGDTDTDPAYRHDKITCLIRPEIAIYEDL